MPIIVSLIRKKLQENNIVRLSILVTDLIHIREENVKTKVVLK